MTFLNPAVLIGLLAASIPVLIHLLNLRKLKKIEFSTLAFLKELQKNKIRKIKIKQWLLLALRVLIILFIVLAFARPALRGLSIAGTTSAAKTSSVFVLDNSFSMSVLGQSGSYFNQAKYLTKLIANQLGEGDESFLILLSDNIPDLKPTQDFNSFNSNLNLSKISFSKGNLQNALLKAGELANGSKNFNREIYLFTDFQKNIFPDDMSVSDMSELLNENIKLYSFPFSEKKVFNLGIDDLKINSQIFEKDKPIEFTITVSNYSDRDYQNGVISLFFNDKRVAQKSYDVDAGKSSLINIEASASETGYINIRAEIESDDIEQDNKRFGLIYIPETIKVLLISDDNISTKFIKLALQTIEENKIILDEKKTSQFNSLPLIDYDVIIYCSDKSGSDNRKFKEVFSQGIGVMLVPPFNVNLNDFNNLLRQINLPVAQSFAGKINDKSISVKFDKIDFEHPLFRNIFLKEDKKSIESPSFNYFIKYSTGGYGQNIITLSEGSSFLSEFKQIKSKVLLFNSAHDLSWNDFPLKTIYAPLLIKSIFYLSQKEQKENYFIAGNTVFLNSNKFNSALLRVVKPDSTEELVNLSGSDKATYEYKNLDISGIYKFYSGDQLIEEIAVNHDKSESNPDYADKQEIRKYLDHINFKGNLIVIDKNDNPLEAIKQARFGSELWRIFLLIAIFLAVAEMTIARNVKKEVEGISQIN